MTLYDANFILQVQHTHLYTSISILPLSKNPSFGLIFETFFSPYSIILRGWKEKEKEKHRKKWETEREREGTFCYGKIGGNGRNEEVFILRKKGNMSAWGGQWAFPMDLIGTGPRPIKI